MAQIIYHSGTGTFFQLDDDSYIIHTGDLPDGVLDQLYEGTYPEVEQYGVELKILLPEVWTVN